MRLMGRPEDVQRVKAILDAQLENHRGGRPIKTTDVAQRLRDESPTPNAATGSEAEADRARRSVQVRPRTPLPRTAVT
jgi:hypothetical protein